MRTTDAIITEHDAVTGQPHPADARDMASDQEAARVRDSILMPLGIFPVVYVDERAKEWFKQDSKGLKPWLVTLADGSTHRVSRMLDMLAFQPGNKFEANGEGGVNFVSSDLSPAAPISGGATPGLAEVMGYTIANSKMEDRVAALETTIKRLADAIDLLVKRAGG